MLELQDEAGDPQGHRPAKDPLHHLLVVGHHLCPGLLGHGDRREGEVYLGIHLAGADDKIEPAADRLGSPAKDQILRAGDGHIGITDGWKKTLHRVPPYKKALGKRQRAFSVVMAATSSGEMPFHWAMAWQARATFFGSFL